MGTNISKSIRSLTVFTASSCSLCLPCTRIAYIEAICAFHNIYFILVCFQGVQFCLTFPAPRTHTLSTMLLTLIVVALTAWQSLVAAAPIEKTKETCIHAHHVLALTETLHWLQLNSTADAVDLPVIPEQYITSPSSCLPASLHQLFVDPVVQMAKEKQLLSKLDRLLQLPSEDKNSQPRALLEKRARRCPDIKKATIRGVSAYSCRSAPNPAHCDSCTNFATFNFMASCVACASKRNQESAFCCAASAATFATYYTQVCLFK